MAAARAAEQAAAAARAAAARVAATRPEGVGDKCSDVAKGYTCNPNQGRG